MPDKYISVTNARVHNLKNVSVKIPKNKFTVITGLSGSGKSSLAFDTIYAEGQRRYAESLSAYARQFMDIQDKPDVDEIKGLSPTIAIDQKNISQNPRSTVGTTTEIYDYLRLLFARLGTQYDPETNTPVIQYTSGEIAEKIRELARTTNELTIIAPLTYGKTVKPKALIASVEQSGYTHLRLNGVRMTLPEFKKYKFDSTKTYDIDAIVGCIDAGKKINIPDIVEKALDLTNGFLVLMDDHTDEEHLFSTRPYSAETQTTFDQIEPRSFSFNSPYGACPRCTGLGYTLDVEQELVIPNPRLTLAEGAIQPWTRIVGNQSQYQKLLKTVADAHDFSVDMPVKDLPQKVMDILYYGTDGQSYDVEGKTTFFEGIVPNLITRHAQTDSEYIRKEIEQYMREKICPVCEGKRLKRTSLFVKIGDYTIADVVEMNIESLATLFQSTGVHSFLKSVEKKHIDIAVPICKEIRSRLENLCRVGLPYLTLNRSVTTLSGGEAQRIRLSTQLSTGLTDVIYILDEPSIGLHPRDNMQLIDTLKTLRDIGNTVIVVEHDQATIEQADFVIDVGPGAGTYGGEIIATGKAAQIKKNKQSLTGLYLSGEKIIAAKAKYRKGNGTSIDVIGATAFNLQNVDASFPLGTFTCVTGVSGSGKSSLVIDTLARALSKHFYRAKAEPGSHKAIKGVKNIDKVISIDQAPIGRTPRSNPATYTGVFTAIRDVFTSQPESKMRGYDAGMFSFNVKGGGRCEACSGEGYRRIPMQFLADVFVECSECEGRRYNKEALDIHYRGKNIADVLEMTIEQSFRFFHDVPVISDKLKLLRDVGLGYVHLGQPATTLSGGEAQRIKLATELSRRSTGKTLYILDEPTTGLHFEDITRLLDVLNKLVDKGNTVITIEHNLDIIKSADYVIDLGPEGGNKGGYVVAAGTPKEILKEKKSLTAVYLREAMKAGKK
ncbi:MAG: excinuclease ABC subunit UvrA [Candidatus Magasanikbacteria bacterium CG10_big_fil_rev_8_21_14_0_10_47_10]|uniref:UvrABC system protein A n=1 Tax=Candidatus Magasanikbacteria bacterium CG10_big_fil_rev_8_21_14_0_10_47_10 TaxID=1974652 RepID=A0A2H0TT12_9BACT|nr:MAG: excinuclease ABC subunit UvrA [Candidatus Magasanikbacteria bacterium CG10_big_fil_rev_8_21_14_0_10_47_10]